MSSFEGDAIDQEIAAVQAQIDAIKAGQNMDFMAQAEVAGRSGPPEVQAAMERAVIDLMRNSGMSEDAAKQKVAMDMFGGSSSSADWKPDSFSDTVMTYAPKYLKGMAALPDMMIGAGDWLAEKATGTEAIPDDWRLRNAVDALAGGREKEAESTLGKYLSRGVEFLGGLGGGGVVGKALGAGAAIPGATGRVLGGAERVLNPSSLKAMAAPASETLLSAAAGQTVEEAGGPEWLERAAEFLAPAGTARTVRGARNVATGLWDDWLAQTPQTAAEFRARDLLRGVEDAMPSGEASIARPVSDYQKDIRAIFPEDAVVGATGKESAKTVDKLASATNASEARGNLVISDIEAAKSQVGREISEAEDTARIVFDSMKTGQRNIVKGAITQMKRSAENFPATATEADKALINFLNRVDNVADHPLDNLLAIRSKAVEAQRNGSELAGEILRKIDGNEAGKVSGVIGQLPAKTKKAYTAVVESRAKMIPLSPDQPLGRVIKGQTQAGVGKRYEVSPEELFTSKAEADKGVLGSKKNVEDVLDNLSPKAKGAMQSDTVGYVMQLKADQRVTFLDKNSPALSKLYGNKAFAAIRAAIKKDADTVGGWISKNSPPLVQWLSRRAVGPIASKALGGMAGATAGLLGGIGGMTAGAIGGATLAGKLAARIRESDDLVAHILMKVRDDPDLALKLMSKPTPENLKKGLAALGITIERGTLNSIIGGKTNDLEVDNKPVQPKKKVSTEVMAKPESPIKPVAARSDALGDLVEAVIHQESRGRANAVSPKGAQGLMQLMPATGIDMMRQLGMNPKEYDPFNPELNRKLGTEYLRTLLKRYHGDKEMALAAYNWGMGNLEKAMTKYRVNNFTDLLKYMPKDHETAKYVPSVMARLAKKVTTLEA